MSRARNPWSGAPGDVHLISSAEAPGLMEGVGTNGKHESVRARRPHTPLLSSSAPQPRQIVRLRVPHGGPQAKSDPLLTPAWGGGCLKHQLRRNTGCSGPQGDNACCWQPGPEDRGPSQPHPQDNRAGGWKGKCPHPKQHALRTRG